MTRDSLLPVGTMTFLVSDDGVDVFTVAGDALTAAVARRAEAYAGVRIAQASGDARRNADRG
jgi:hypothetical protein